jgi:hypothetical protein
VAAEFSVAVATTATANAMSEIIDACICFDGRWGRVDTGT